MRHGHDACKIVAWQFSQSQAEKLGRDVTNSLFLTIYIVMGRFKLDLIANLLTILVMNTSQGLSTAGPTMRSVWLGTWSTPQGCPYLNPRSSISTIRPHSSMQ